MGSLEDKQAELYMQLFMRQTDMGVIRCRMDNALSILFCSQTIGDMMGYSPETFCETFHNSFMEAVCNTDRMDFRRKLRTAQQKKAIFETEISLKQNGGKLLLVQLSAMFEEDAQEGSYVVCMVRNTQHVRELERQLRMQSARYQVLKKITNEPIFEYDDLSDTMVISRNEENTRPWMIHNYRSQIAQSGYIHPDDVEQYIREFDAALNRDTMSTHEFRAKLFDSEYIWYRAIDTNILDEETGMTKLIGKIENIHADKLRQQELLKKSMYDAMTGLLNRNVIQHEVEEQLQRMPDARHAMMIVDIDNFKLVNDNLGHLFGDTVLTNFAAELRRIFSERSVVGRIGGDEFLVLLCDASDEEVESKAKEVCRIFDYVYSGNLNEIHVSTSVGISWYREDADTYKELFAHADQALYESKRNGKNQYNYYRSEQGDTLAASDSELHDHYRMDPGRQSVSNQQTRDMIEFAFHILTETKDILSGIGLVLESLCKRMQMQVGVLIEENEFAGGGRISYLWTAERGMSCAQDQPGISEQEFRKLISRLGEKNYFAAGELEELCDLPQLRALVQHSGGNSILCDGMLAGAQSVQADGALVLADASKHRTFSMEERNLIRVVSKIIASYLFQVRGTQRVRRKVDRLMNYDAVTGWYRFDKFKQELRRILDEPETSQNYVYALFYTDIRNFKNVNDIYGYSVGDQVLYELAQVLSERDNFVCGCRNFADNMISLMRLQKHDNYVFQMLQVEEAFKRRQRQFLRHTTSLATGIYFIRDRHIQASQMIDNANLARKQSKENRSRTCFVFDEKLERQFSRTQQIEACMEEALQGGEFKVFIQPKYDLKTGRIVAAEALTRWQRPDGKFVYPDAFIPVFEKNGFITKLDFHVLETICKTLQTRMDKQQACVSISINQSRYLLHSAHYVEKIRHMLEQYQIPPGILEFELTESLFFEDSRAMVNIMHRLKQLGLAVSIDDFGSGYSSLNVLKELPADIIKLDKEFLSASGEQTESEIIIRKTVEMAKELHKKVVCEGVETNEQADFLRAIGCDMAQGYLYAKPMPMEAFFALLEQDPYKKIGDAV